MDITKNWLSRAFALLDNSLQPVPQEMNEIDWKESLSPKGEKLAQHLSAFANNPGGGILVFGIEDKSGIVIGINQQDAENIMGKLSSVGRDSLDPMVIIDHSIELYQDKPLLFVYIKESSIKPVHFKSKSIEESYIRTGGTTRKASRQEVGGFMLNSKTPQFEELHSSKVKSEFEVLTILDYKTIFKLLEKPVPSNIEGILYLMEHEKMIEKVDGVGYYITNFGALSAANNLLDFDHLARKTIRLIRYKGLNKNETIKEFPGSKGYAIGFEGLIDFVKQLLPSSEIIKSAFRAELSIYPEIALRELFANALIHQDFTIKGTGPVIEIFDDRISITNPGRLLPTKKIERLIGTTPESRNEVLASSFRRFSICEERGSGFTKTVSAIEFYGLPPLKIEELENSFRVTMYVPKAFAQLTEQERIEACYQHSIVRYLSSGSMNNTSLRERFKMSERQRPQVSIVIKNALIQGRIKPKDPLNASTKYVEYIPYWG
ncbi:ATP-binding protein [uncultured Mucilaginibacter sp.]|uniref:ATP-binding protein n=1 Tax=uncultured Mucilaginibacter sp. TaxID=797541 RepID=UPI00263A0182|nr:ATP-binding protein [uncultured Mucilaginibacter sp.]